MIEDGVARGSLDGMVALFPKLRWWLMPMVMCAVPCRGACRLGFNARIAAQSGLLGIGGQGDLCAIDPACAARFGGLKDALGATMGDGFAALPCCVGAVHAGDREFCLGEIEVATSPHAFWRGNARLAGLPQADERGGDVPGQDWKLDPDRGRWHRHISGRMLYDKRLLGTATVCLVEHMGPLTGCLRVCLGRRQAGGLNRTRYWALGIPPCHACLARA